MPKNISISFSGIITIYHLKTENHGKFLRFQSENEIKKNIHIILSNLSQYCFVYRETGTRNLATVFHQSMQPQNWDFIS